jgi:predicted alpha/beta-fold hydrolase
MTTFSPPRFLRNGHIQSILPTLKWRAPLLAYRSASLRAVAKEHILDCGDDVRLLGIHSAHGDQPRPLVMLMHGWEGHVNSQYLLSLSSHLFGLGYDIFRLNFRDHGPTHHLNRDIFHSCRLEEVVGAVRAVQTKFTPPALSLAGFSLGGNFSLRVAKRAPQAGIALQCAVAICPVLSPRRTMEAMATGWSVYEQYFIRKWKNSLRIKQKHFPEHYDFGKIFAMKTLEDMTKVLVKDHCEYPDLHTYLDGYSIVDERLADLQVPSHIFLAADDPIIPARDAVHLAKSDNLSVSIIPNGGHCGFLDGFKNESWADRQVAAIMARRMPVESV